MNDTNELIIIGTVTRPGITMGDNHSKVSVKVEREYNGKTYADFVEIVKWRSTELSGYYEGQRVRAIGQAKVGRPWTNKDGEAKSGNLELHADRVELLPDSAVTQDTDVVPTPVPTTEDNSDIPF